MPYLFEGFSIPNSGRIDAIQSDKGPSDSCCNAGNCFIFVKNKYLWTLCGYLMDSVAY